MPKRKHWPKRESPAARRCARRHGRRLDETDIALLMRRTAGLNVKIISGYPDSKPSTSRSTAASWRVASSALSAVASTRPEWLKDGGIMQPLMQFARATRHPRFADTPTARELAATSAGVS